MEVARFEQYVRRYADTVYRIALNYTRNPHDSEDVLQNVMLRFYRSMGKLGGEEYIKAWLIRVTINESKRFLKRNRSRATVSLGNYANTVYQNDFEDRELFLEVMSLDAKYRDVLYLFYFEHYTTDEIASLTGTKPSTVRTRLSRARELLRTRLEDEA